MTDAERFVWIAENAQRMRITPYGDCAIEWVSDTGHLVTTRWERLPDEKGGEVAMVRSAVDAAVGANAKMSPVPKTS